MSHGSRNSGIVPPRSSLYQGLFGRLFPDLPPWEAPVPESQLDAFFQDVATNQMVEPNDSDSLNSSIPAAYTYFGQFVDHDITFDTTSSLMRQNDPQALHNFRTPRLDLDCVYGSGRTASPHLYESRKGRFLIGEGENSREPDLPRNQIGTALIGDPRNDENVVVSQIQLSMLKLHNRLFDALEPTEGASAFDEARRILTWTYQYIVWNDFLRRILNEKVWSNVMKLEESSTGTKRWKVNSEFYRWRNSPFMPVEFSVAAYRFGHSLVRSSYQLNNVKGFGVQVPIFDLANDPDGSLKLDLRGGRQLPASHTIQWDWFLDIDSGGPFPQVTRKIDPLLSQALAAIPAGPGGNNALAFLNLKRSLRMELPSGSDVARYMGITPQTITEPHQDILWFYILNESTGDKMGPVGSVIVAEVFAGLLANDPNSFFNVDPTWNPSNESVLTGFPEGAPFGADWDMRDIVRLAQMPINNADSDTLING